MAKSLNEHPPEVGDLVHIYLDNALPPYDLNFRRLTKFPNALTAVPLGIVTQPSRPCEEEEEDDPRVGGQWRIATLSRRGKRSPAAGTI
jgi:hypothetical protein